MSDEEENDLLDRVREAQITPGTDDDWVDFWASEDPTEFLLNNNKLEALNGEAVDR